MTKPIAIIIGLVLLVVLVLFSTTYTVRYNEVAIRTRFGETDENSIVTDAGLHFRLPLFADKITTIDTRIQLRETGLEQIQTRDGQQVVVRAFLMWQVNKEDDGPLRFAMNHPGGVEEANQWLAGQFTTALRTGLSAYTFDELIGSQTTLARAEQAVRDEMANVMQVGSRGIEPKAVGISQLVLPPRTTTAVLRRMEATRSYLSESERYLGEAAATGIETRANGQSERIRHFANQWADEIRMEGNKDAAVYIQRMGEEPGLAIFLSWLDTLEASLSERTTFVVPTFFAPFHLLRLDTPTDSYGMPQPLAENGRLSADRPEAATAKDGVQPNPAIQPTADSISSGGS